MTRIDADKENYKQCRRELKRKIEIKIQLNLEIAINSDKGIFLKSLGAC